MLARVVHDLRIVTKYKGEQVCSFASTGETTRSHTKPWELCTYREKVAFAHEKLQSCGSKNRNPSAHFKKKRGKEPPTEATYILPTSICLCSSSLQADTLFGHPKKNNFQFQLQTLHFVMKIKSEIEYIPINVMYKVKGFIRNHHKIQYTYKNLQIKIPIKIHGFSGAKPLNSKHVKIMNLFILPKQICIFKQKKKQGFQI